MLGVVTLVGVARGFVVMHACGLVIAFVGIRGKKLRRRTLESYFLCHGLVFTPRQKIVCAISGTSPAKVIAWAPHDRLRLGLPAARGLEDLLGKRFGSVVEKDRVIEFDIMLAEVFQGAGQRFVFLQA